MWTKRLRPVAAPLDPRPLPVHPRRSCPYPQLMEETARAVCHLRTHFPTYFPAMSLSVHPRRSCPHPQLTEEAARPRHPHPKASRTSYLRRSRLNPELTEAAAQLSNPHQPSNSTLALHLQQHCPHPEPTGKGERHLTTRRTTNSTMNSTV